MLHKIQHARSMSCLVLGKWCMDHSTLFDTKKKEKRQIIDMMWYDSLNLSLFEISGTVFWDSKC